MKCLECGHDLEIMRQELIGFTVDAPKDEHDCITYWDYSHTEYAGHCRSCLWDWEWNEYFKDGKFEITQPQRIFWG